MSARVSFHKDARREARDARYWFQDRNPSTVSRFTARVDAAVAQLREFPQSGAPPSTKRDD